MQSRGSFLKHATEQIVTGGTGARGGGFRGVGVTSCGDALL